MALVNRGIGSGFVATLTLTDLQGDSYNKRYDLRSATYAAAVTDTDLIIAGLGPVTRSVLTSVAISQVRDEDTNFLPATESDKSIYALVSYKLAGRVKKESLEIPDPDPLIFVSPSGPSANQVNVSNADVIAYTDLFKATGVAFISDGEDLDIILSGRRKSKST